MTRFVRTRVLTWAALLIVIFAGLAGAQSGQSDKLPLLADEPVNDFAHVLDPSQEAAIKQMSATLKAATGDIVYLVTVETFAPYGSIQELAVKLFENQGRGIGEKGKDNGLLVVLAVKDRQVWIEVGYGLEGFITDGFSGETSRQYMIPYFRKGEYGEGLRVGVQRVIARIAQGRNVSLENVHAPSAPQSERRSRRGGIPFGFYVILAIIVINVLSNGFGGGGRRRGGRWGGGGWSGWSGGVGGFGGGGGSWGGGFGGGGGGGGGGFGGFGGGRSGGGGGGGSW